MNWAQQQLEYRKSAVTNATPIGLVVILYDTLITDFRRAIAAMKVRDYEVISNELKHSLMVLQQLEGSLDFANGGECAKSLEKFYSILRANVMNAQIKVSPEILEHQIGLILQVRETWQEVDKPRQSVPAPMPAAVPTVVADYAEIATTSVSWSV